jgi:hypothetical protein
MLKSTDLYCCIQHRQAKSKNHIRDFHMKYFIVMNDGDQIAVFIAVMSFSLVDRN